MVEGPLSANEDLAGKQKRNKTIKLSVISSLISKLVGSVIQFFALPLAMHQMSTEDYAVFIAVGTLASMAATANLGVGPGLTRSLTHFATDPNEDEERSWFMSGLVLVAAFAGVLVLIGLLLPLLVPLTVAFGAGNPEVLPQVTTAYFVMVFIAVAMNFMSLSEATYVGFLEGYWPKIYYLFGYLLSCGAIVFVAFKMASPWAMILAVYGVPLIPLGYGLFRLLWNRRHLIGPLAVVTKEKLTYILRTNLGSTSSQLGELLTFQFGTLMIGNSLGPAAQGKFGTLFQWFLMASALRTMVLGPLGATVANAWVKGDDVWLKGALTKAFALVGGMGVVAAGVLVLFGSPITAVLFKPEFFVEPHVFWGFAFMLLSSFLVSSLLVLIMAFDRYGLAGAVTLARGVVILLVTMMSVKTLGIEGFYWFTGGMLLLSFVVMVWAMRGQLGELAARMRAVGSGS